MRLRKTTGWNWGGEKMELKKSYGLPALLAGGIVGTLVLGMSAASASPAEGQKLAFDRSKGNCITCHEIKGAQNFGNPGPVLNDMKKRFSRADLKAIISDETKRNPQTVMPPFKRNLILTDQEIDSIIDYLYTR
jgi:sulfur-oxidizing protein SoxX